MVQHMLSDEAITAMIERGTQIGSHAGQEACNAMVRITDTLPNGRERVFAICVAFGYLTAKMEALKATDPWMKEGLELLGGLGKKFIDEKMKMGEL